MAKNTLWFKHDFNARNDDKLRCLITDFGILAIGVYWVINEMLYESENSSISETEIKIIAKSHNTDFEIVNQIIGAMIEYNLYQKEDGLIFCKTVLKRKAESLSQKEKFSTGGKVGMANRWKNKDLAESYNQVIESYNPLITKNNQVISSNNNDITSDNRIEKNRKEEKEKINKKENVLRAKEVFESFRKKFGGSKRGLDVEFDNFVKKTPDWEQVLPHLEPAIEKEIANRERLKQQGKFVPEWKNLQTWINGKYWTQEFEATQKPSEPSVPYRLTMADVDYDPTNTHIYGGDGFNIRGEDRDGFNRQGLNEYGYTREQWAEKQRSKAS